MDHKPIFWGASWLMAWDKIKSMSKHCKLDASTNYSITPIMRSIYTLFLMTTRTRRQPLPASGWRPTKLSPTNYLESGTGTQGCCQASQECHCQWGWNGYCKCRPSGKPECQTFQYQRGREGQRIHYRMQQVIW
jgi:hypothetical protein